MHVPHETLMKDLGSLNSDADVEQFLFDSNIHTASHHFTLDLYYSKFTEPVRSHQSSAGGTQSPWQVQRHW